MSTEEWVQLEETDDWGYHFLRVQDKSIKGRMSSRRDAILFPKDTARVLWPNGLEQNVKIGSESGTTSVSDHGKQYSVSWQIPVILATINGVKAKIEAKLVLVHKDSFISINDVPHTDQGPPTFHDPSNFGSVTSTRGNNGQ